MVKPSSGEEYKEGEIDEILKKKKISSILLADLKNVIGSELADAKVSIKLRSKFTGSDDLFEIAKILSDPKVKKIKWSKEAIDIAKKAFGKDCPIG